MTGTIEVSPDSFLWNYARIRQAQRLLTELAHIQADLAMSLEYGDLEDSLDVILLDLSDMLKEMRRHKKAEDAAVRRSLAKVKADRQKLKKGKVEGNVVRLKTKGKGRPKT